MDVSGLISMKDIILLLLQQYCAKKVKLLETAKRHLAGTLLGVDSKLSKYLKYLLMP